MRTQHWPCTWSEATVLSVKKIWDKLATTYEGTRQVKESKIGLLTLSCEFFMMKSGESIKEMSDRFTNIINNLKALGKTYFNKEIVTP
ncbi:hypothetical protein J1N35_011237 [Gossypium stocksii]|uniref:Uncharacterized protein n=1 Tax=Gossypium stocksii TaxID=47602 RepID=A0A9D3W1R8_9ROSI|nr:hypothetical protein J1N35_011237 [Gossypium stocksii]